MDKLNLNAAYTNEMTARREAVPAADYEGPENRAARRVAEGIPVAANLRALSRLRGVSRKGFGEELALPPEVERKILGFVTKLTKGKNYNSTNLTRNQLNTLRRRRENALRRMEIERQEVLNIISREQVLRDAAARERENFLAAARLNNMASVNSLQDAIPADTVIPDIIPAVNKYEQRRAVEKSRTRRGKTTNFRSKPTKPFAGNKTKKRTNRSTSRRKSKGSKGSKQ
jgi:hypothetical protein